MRYKAPYFACIGGCMGITEKKTEATTEGLGFVVYIVT